MAYGMSFFIICFIGLLFQSKLLGQCEIRLNKCVQEASGLTPLYFFIENAYEYQPYKQRIYLLQGHEYRFSACNSIGQGSIIFGLQDLQGNLIKNNIVDFNEISQSFDWRCEKSGTYVLAYWISEGSGCIAVQISIKSFDKSVKKP